MYKFEKITGGFLFKAPSRRKGKKYDAFTMGGDYITSFGGIHKNGVPYEQFKDLIGYYKKYDHGSMRRKAFYYDRHGRDATPLSAKYFSSRFLW